MLPFIQFVFVAFVGGATGGAIGWISTWHTQKRANRRSYIDNLKCRLYSHLELTVQYWVNDNSMADTRPAMEARMIASQNIILMECEFAKKSKYLRKSNYKTQNDALIELLDATTGGCFQQKENWKPDTERSLRATNALEDVINSFYR